MKHIFTVPLAAQIALIEPTLQLSTEPVLAVYLHVSHVIPPHIVFHAKSVTFQGLCQEPVFVTAKTATIPQK